MYGVNLVLFGLIFGLVIIPEVGQEFPVSLDNVEAYGDTILINQILSVFSHSDFLIHYCHQLHR